MPIRRTARRASARARRTLIDPLGRAVTDTRRRLAHAIDPRPSRRGRWIRAALLVAGVAYVLRRRRRLRLGARAA